MVFIDVIQHVMCKFMRYCEALTNRGLGGINCYPLELMTANQSARNISIHDRFNNRKPLRSSYGLNGNWDRVDAMFIQ